MTKFLNISTDNTLGGNSPSDDVVSSQKAVQEYVDSHSSSVSLDNSTISTNSSNQLQAIGLINKNTASSATNPKYDWVGTLQEYNDQAVATNHPEWICYITDDVSGGESVYTKNEVDTLLNAKANDSDVVKLTGNQTVGGVKTFTNQIYYNRANDARIRTIAPNLTNGTTPSATQWTGIDLLDKNNVEMAQHLAFVNTNGDATSGQWVRVPGTTTTGFGVRTLGNINTGAVETYAITPATSDNSTKIATTAFVRNVLGAIYPVGSCYIGTTSTCPLAAFFGTWTLESTGIVTSVNTNVPVKGNGYGLGLTNGTTETQMTQLNYNSDWFGLNQNPSVTSPTLVGTSVERKILTGNKVVGVSTDATKSGIVGTVTRSVSTINIFRRTA